MPAKDKESLWQHLKENHPDKAKSLATVMADSFVKLIMDKTNGLGALLAIELEYAPVQSLNDVERLFLTAKNHRKRRHLLKG